MKTSIKSEPGQVLKIARSILLIDWPDTHVPFTLIRAGFKVYSYSPDKYAEATIVVEYEKEQLAFNEINGAPGDVDIVNIFRPEGEHEDIFKKHILPLHAKTVWVQPPAISVTARDLAAAYNLEFFEGVAIVDIAAKI